MMNLAKGIYQHYKGNYYEVLGIAKHTETLEQMVVCRALYDNFELWIRPLSMFIEDVEINGVLKKRFNFIGDRMPVTHPSV